MAVFLFGVLFVRLFMHFYFNKWVFMNAMHLLHYVRNDEIERHCEEVRRGSLFVSSSNIEIIHAFKF